ncbi:hypothetical protein [Sutterella wadsworthensis]|jgi:hypothetical protein|uniref:hypothetical protein n=1 Tax=Sutterella wadsworthensis TaxID=40545 RepID=UPI0013F654CB|nr:hypothetical protein [Sutterella wadsworthensis]
MYSSLADWGSALLALRLPKCCGLQPGFHQLLGGPFGSAASWQETLEPAAGSSGFDSPTAQASENFTSVHALAPTASALEQDVFNFFESLSDVFQAVLPETPNAKIVGFAQGRHGV